MQKLAEGSKHIAEWGNYQVVIDLRKKPLLLIRDNSPPYQQHLETPCLNADDAIMTAGQWLERRGSMAMVDGKRRSLASFLFFIPDGIS